jgi:hypothetical protein
VCEKIEKETKLKKPMKNTALKEKTLNIILPQ